MTATPALRFTSPKNDYTGTNAEVGMAVALLLPRGFAVALAFAVGLARMRSRCALILGLNELDTKY